ncbi:MAG: SMC family ATPase [Thermosynechococcaceae cyanobacterium]
MEIRSLTLKNFKTHADSHYEFRSGTNAICGENGAGKTSILEAIAWVLFDHCDYTRGELIRTGAKSTQVTVAFVSSADERVYEVRRCTSRGYELHDPQLKINLGHRKLEDVQAWMRSHLGVPPQTDLSRLFAETIGIPQGTFTTDFLKRPVERKKIFDPILKVEEYKQTYDQLRDLETYARAQVSSLSQQLDHYTQQLADWDDLQQQAATLKTAIAQDEAQIAQLTHDADQRQTEVAQLTESAQRVQALEAQVLQLETQWVSKTETLKLLEEACETAQKAAEICRAKRPSFQTYETAQATLQTLAEQRRQQQVVLQQREVLRQRLGDREVEVSQLTGQLATFAELRRDFDQWQALVPQQTQLEQQLQPVQQALQNLAHLKLQRQTLQAQISQVKAQGEQLAAEITRLSALTQQVEQLPTLEQDLRQVQVQLSQIEAGQGFADQLHAIAGPAQGHYDRHRQQVMAAKQKLTQILPNPSDATFVQQVLETGAGLNAKLLRSLQDLLAVLTDPTATATLAQQIQDLTHAIQTARTLQQQLAALPIQRQQLTEVKAQWQQLQQQIESCDRQLDQEPTLETQLQQLNQQLQQLNDPKGHLRILQQQLQPETQIQRKLAQLQLGLNTLRQEQVQLEQQMATFGDLEAQFEAQQALLQTHHADYQLYLRHRNEANSWRTLGPQCAAARTELSALQTNVENLRTLWQQAQQAYDPQQLLQAQVALAQLQEQKNQLQGGLPPKQTQLADLQHRLQERQGLAERQQRDRQVLLQKQQVLQFVIDARHIFNQSGPRITRYYLAEVSLEADKLFRELLNRDEVTLEWTEDYDIRVKERGYERSFRSLSGGEQMCAALAVRLALLRVLADIDIAFFDEPTTNMDQVRRQQLAEAISHLKAFRQLIVISHDDTFENITEHVIRLERQTA